MLMRAARRGGCPPAALRNAILPCFSCRARLNIARPPSDVVIVDEIEREVIFMTNGKLYTDTRAFLVFIVSSDSESEVLR